MRIKVMFAAIAVIAIRIASTSGESIPAFDAQKLFSDSTHVAVVVVSSDEQVIEDSTANVIEPINASPSIAVKRVCFVVE